MFFEHSTIYHPFTILKCLDTWILWGIFQRWLSRLSNPRRSTCRGWGPRPWFPGPEGRSEVGRYHAILGSQNGYHPDPHGGFCKWGYPNIWMVYFMEHLKLKWMMTGGTPILGNLHMPGPIQAKPTNQVRIKGSTAKLLCLTLILKIKAAKRPWKISTYKFFMALPCAASAGLKLSKIFSSKKYPKNGKPYTIHWTHSKGAYVCIDMAFFWTDIRKWQTDVLWFFVDLWPLPSGNLT